MNKAFEFREAELTDRIAKQAQEAITREAHFAEEFEARETAFTRVLETTIARRLVSAVEMRIILKRSLWGVGTTKLAPDVVTDRSDTRLEEDATADGSDARLEEDATDGFANVAP